MPALELDTNAQAVLPTLRAQSAGAQRGGVLYSAAAPRGVTRAASRARRVSLPRPRLLGRPGPQRLSAAVDARRARPRPDSPTWTGASRAVVSRRRRTRRGGGGARRHGAGGHEGRALVLAAGTFGDRPHRAPRRSIATTRRCRFVCNPYAYVPTMNLGMLDASRATGVSLAQLTAMVVRESRPAGVQAQLFSYRSLLTFKLMKELPLAGRQARRILRALIPAVRDPRHPSRGPARPGKSCMLRRGGRSARPARDPLPADDEENGCSATTSACSCAGSAGSGVSRLKPSGRATGRASTTPAPFRSSARTARSPAIATPASRRRAPSTWPTARCSPGLAEGAHVQHHGQRRPRRRARADGSHDTTVAVTGASGFLGRALCAHPGGPRGGGPGAGARSGAPSPTPGRARRRCDLPDAIEESALEGAAAVVHCAYATREVDLGRAAARQRGRDPPRAGGGAPRRGAALVFVSTWRRTRSAPSYYARSKHAAGGACSIRRATPSSAPASSSAARATACSSSCSTTCAACASCPSSAAGAAAPDRARRRRVRGDRAHRRARAHGAFNVAEP